MSRERAAAKYYVLLHSFRGFDIDFVVMPYSVMIFPCAALQITFNLMSRLITSLEARHDCQVWPKTCESYDNHFNDNWIIKFVRAPRDNELKGLMKY